jgi:hypothetical protein
MDVVEPGARRPAIDAEFILRNLPAASSTVKKRDFFANLPLFAA